MKRLPELPFRVPVGHVVDHHVQVLDDQNQPLAFPIREVLKSAEAAVGQRPIVPDRPQLFERAAQVRAVAAVRRLLRQAGEAFEPELSGAGDFVAFFGEDDREEAGREPGVPAYLCADPQQQTRLAAAARPDHDLMLIRTAGARPHNLDHRRELVGAHAEGRNKLLVREKPGVVFSGGHGHHVVPPSCPRPRRTDTKFSPYRLRHQSSRSPDTKR